LLSRTGRYGERNMNDAEQLGQKPTCQVGCGLLSRTDCAVSRNPH
jgi:hypothetical protein